MTSGRWALSGVSSISTHTLRKEGDVAAEVMADDRYSISTHTLRKEGDNFLLTEGVLPDDISTHTLRKEGDREGYGILYTSKDFNPHPPQGG